MTSVRPRIDPVKILEAIAADETVTPTARVAACRKLLAMQEAKAKKRAGNQVRDANLKSRQADKHARQHEEANRRAVEMMNGPRH
jgi:hypothetical protein